VKFRQNLEIKREYFCDNRDILKVTQSSPIFQCFFYWRLIVKLRSVTVICEINEREIERASRIEHLFHWSCSQYLILADAINIVQPLSALHFLSLNLSIIVISAPNFHLHLCAILHFPQIDLLSLDLLSPPNPSFREYPQSKKKLLNLGMKC
jgi:hypothetical protein